MSDINMELLNTKKQAKRAELMPPVLSNEELLDGLSMLVTEINSGWKLNELNNYALKCNDSDLLKLAGASWYIGQKLEEFINGNTLDDIDLFKDIESSIDPKEVLEKFFVIQNYNFEKINKEFCIKNMDLRPVVIRLVWIFMIEARRRDLIGVSIVENN